MHVVEVDDEARDPVDPDQVPRSEVAVAEHLRLACESRSGNRVVVAAEQRTRRGQLAVAPGELAGVGVRLALQERQDVAALLVYPEPARRCAELDLPTVDEHCPQ